MRHSESINEIAAALAKAQAELKPAIKDAVNPAFRSKYADLAAVWEAWHAVGPKHGIATVQDVTTEERGIAVATSLLHASGQWLEFGPLTVPLSKHDAHGVGSATSYAKRYGLAAAVGVVAEDDDDGNAAAKGAPKNGRMDRSDDAMAQRRQESAQSGPYAAREAAKTEDKEYTAVANFDELMARRAALPEDAQAHVPTDPDMHAMPPAELTELLPGYIDAIGATVKRRKLSAEEQAELKAKFLGNPRAQLAGQKHNPFFIYALFKHMRTDQP